MLFFSLEVEELEVADVASLGGQLFVPADRVLDGVAMAERAGKAQRCEIGVVLQVRIQAVELMLPSTQHALA